MHFRLGIFYQWWSTAFPITRGERPERVIAVHSFCH
jgi:hypothetical protein